MEFHRIGVHYFFSDNMEFHIKILWNSTDYDFTEYFFIQFSAVNLHAPFHSFEKECCGR